MEFKIEKLQTFTGHKSSVYGLAKGENSNVFYSVAGDGYVVRWDIEKPEEGIPLLKLINNAYTLKYVAERKLMIVPDNQLGVHWVDVDSKKIIHTTSLPGVSVFDIKISGNDVFLSDNKGSFYKISVSDFSISNHSVQSQKSARAMTVLEDTQEIAIGYSDCTIRIFNLNTFQLKKILNGHDHSVFSVTYLPEKKLLASAGRDAKLIFWNAAGDFELVEKIPAHIYPINHLEILSGTGFLASASMDKTIKIWDTDHLKLKKVIDRGRHQSHNSSVNRLLWLEGQQQLLSASDDRNISLWNLF